MEILSIVRNMLFAHWREVCLKNNRPVYFYVISCTSTTWGCVVPEILGVIKHAKRYNYSVHFISNRTSALETLELFNIVENVIFIDREAFLESAGLSFCNSFLSLRVDNSENLKKICLSNTSITNLFPEIPDFSWPFADMLRCIIHNTEFVHSSFNLRHSTYFQFEAVTTSGMDPHDHSLKLTSDNLLIAESMLPLSKSPRFILSVREAPKFHGTERDTIPESLERLLTEIRKFTSQIYLIGVSPSSKLLSIIKMNTQNIDVFDYTSSNYHTYNNDDINKTSSLQTLVQSYLLSTNNVKLLGTNGICVLSYASNQMPCFYDSAAICMQKMHNALFIPQRFSFAPDLSPMQALIFGLTSLERSDWYTRRIPPLSSATFSALETLVRHCESDNSMQIFRESIFNPRLLPIMRRLIENLPTEVRMSSCLFDQWDFGASLIQDKAGAPIRYA